MATALKTLDLNTTSHRHYDENGYLIIRDNPVAISGVLPFLRREIETANQVDSDDIVYAYRSPESLQRTAHLFQNKPVGIQHNWIGKDGTRFTADGALDSTVTYRDGALYSNIIIYNPEAIDCIESGGCIEISPGYEAKFTKVNGSINGIDYTYEVEFTKVNHIALVPRGRAGHELRILDRKVSMVIQQEAYDKLRKLIIEASQLIDDFQNQQENEDAKAEQDNGVNRNNGSSSHGDSLSSEVNDNRCVRCNTQSKEARDFSRDFSGDKSGDNTRLNSSHLTNRSEASSSITLDSVNELIENAFQKHLSTLQSTLDSANSEYNDAVNTVRSYVADFNPIGIPKIPSEVYRRGFLSLTGRELSPGLEPKTAFLMTSREKNLQSKREAGDNYGIIRTIDSSKFIDFKK